jgi:hypothetical protein
MPDADHLEEALLEVARAQRAALDDLVTAMLERRSVRVLADLRNGVGEVTRPGGWLTLIAEIRRPAANIHAYGHLGPVIVVDGERPHSFVCLRPDQVAVA